MEYITSYKRPNYRQDISPGIVGVIGDVFTDMQQRTSTPDMSPVFVGGGPRWGQNIQDGRLNGYQQHTHQPTTSYIDDLFSFQVGTQYQSLEPEDKFVDPILDGPSSWALKKAGIYAGVTEDPRYLPLPGGYGPQPGDRMRGGNGPVQVAAGTMMENIVDYTGSNAMSAYERTNINTPLNRRQPLGPLPAGRRPGLGPVVPQVGGYGRRGSV